jgi:hypothetical protein
MDDVKKIKAAIRKMAKENAERIKTYKENGGTDTAYLDGKGIAFEEVLHLFKG